MSIQTQPGGNAFLSQEQCTRLKVLHTFTAITDRNHIIGFSNKGRDIGFATIDSKVAMIHELASLSARIGEAEAIHQVIEAHLQDLQQSFASFTRGTSGGTEMPSELTLQHTIGTTYLLFFTQLFGVARLFAYAAAAMLARAAATAFKRAF